jgi:hypothetical protein
MANADRAVSATSLDRDTLESVRGEIAFARRSPDEKARDVVIPTYEDMSCVLYDIPIRNARPIADELSLDKEGFILVKRGTSCAGEEDPVVVRQRYLDEMVPFIKSYFNASWVIPRLSGTYMRRSEGTTLPKEGWNSNTTLRQPAGVAHFDYASVAGPMIAAAENQEQGIPIRPYSRLMVIQAWRALSPPPQDIPLAFCDASTLAHSDVVEYEYVSNLQGTPASASRTTVMRYSPAQRWYYFPDMTADDLILFKGYDSESHYQPRSAHSGFDNRRATPNAKPRASIESRFFVYFA